MYRFFAVVVIVLFCIKNIFETFIYLQAFVACGWGISRVGYVMIAFGIANAVAAGLSGAVSKIIGRNKILLFALIVHGALLLWMRQWTAVANDVFAYSSMAAIWGLVDGIWLVIINCKYLYLI